MTPDERQEPSALDGVVAAFTEVTSGEEVVEFAMTALDRVGAPVWCNWWFDPVRGFGGVGYGASGTQARVGALGELVEHLSSRRWTRAHPPRTGSLAELRRRYGGDAVVDPRRLGLAAGTAFDDDRPLLWWPLRRWSDGAEVWAPVEFVASEPVELTGLAAPPQAGWLTTPVSNGLGAGTSLDQAVAHGVLELLQRDGNGLSFRALDAGRIIELDAVGDPDTVAALEQLAAAGIQVQVKLAATDFEMANVNVVGMGPEDDILSATACGEAVHPDREVAVRKAVHEFAAARARKQLMHGPVEAVLQVAPEAYAAVPAAVDPAQEEHRVLQAMAEWLRLPASTWRPLLEGSVLSDASRVAFSSLPNTSVTGAGLLPDLLHRLNSEGFEVLVRELTGPDGSAYAAKVLVPGLEVETVAYARIGARNAARLVASGRDDLVRVGERPDGWDQIHLTDAGREQLGGPAWLNRPALAAVPGLLFPLYREPGRHAVQKVLGASTR